MKKSRASGRAARAAARQRLETYGVHALSDRELLTALLGDTPPGGFDALLDARGLCGIERCTPDELRRMSGLGPAGAAKVVAAVELGRRTLTRAPKPRVRLEEPWEAAADLVSEYGRTAVQHFGVVMLDVKRRILNTVVLSRGTDEGALVDPREVFGAAIGHRAAAVILFQNHPSGDPTPDVRDVALTARLVEAGVLMGIEVLDHLILSDGGYYSFKREGRLGGQRSET